MQCNSPKRRSPNSQCIEGKVNKNYFNSDGQNYSFYSLYCLIGIRQGFPIASVLQVRLAFLLQIYLYSTAVRKNESSILSAYSFNHLTEGGDLQGYCENEIDNCSKKESCVERKKWNADACISWLSLSTEKGKYWREKRKRRLFVHPLFYLSILPEENRSEFPDKMCKAAGENEESISSRPPPTLHVFKADDTFITACVCIRHVCRCDGKVFQLQCYEDRTVSSSDCRKHTEAEGYVVSLLCSCL